MNIDVDDIYQKIMEKMEEYCFPNGLLELDSEDRKEFAQKIAEAIEEMLL